MEVIKIETSQIDKNHKKRIDNKTKIYYDIFKREDIAKFTYYDYLYIERQKTIHCSEIGQEKLEELIRETKGEDEDMLACVEMIREENKKIREEGIAQGITQGRRSIISVMLKRGMSLEEIREITKATKKEIEEARLEKQKI